MSLLIVIPTYNEKDNISELTNRIFKSSPPDTKILIVDDNSPDGTGEAADDMATEDSRISVLHRQKKEGLGRAYMDGFRHALKNYDAEYIMSMDADLSHDPVFIPKFLEHIASCDIVLGSRFYDGRISIVNWPMTRLILSYSASLYVRICTRIPISDWTGAYRCFRRRAIEKILENSMISNSYAFLIEINYICYKLGFKFGEVPIIFYDRDKGASKMQTSKAILEAIVIVWKLKFRRFGKDRASSQSVYL